jgi:hypothetical protein
LVDDRGGGDTRWFIPENSEVTNGLYDRIKFIKTGDSDLRLLADESYQLYFRVTE